ncbi:Sulfoxide reductase catalytic subunit YedY [Candidatus Tiddalikarchaeum anstoanum]|nr:Sulfoxide reductase catalytic subunit YedY [Candidatus Tiddalikarchaeum anstoanum]
MKALILLIFLLLISGCTASNVISLGSVEISDYNGTRLDSVNDFRENSIHGPQYINIDNYTLEVFGLASNPKDYTYSEVLSHQAYSKIVQINCVEGWSVKILWEGVLVKDLLEEAGVEPEASTIIFHAFDGYSTSFPLSYILDNNILLAYKMNNITIPPERGYPFQLVAENKWGFKWIKWITGIELSSDSSYLGYWESRGYNNNADLNGSKFS